MQVRKRSSKLRLLAIVMSVSVAACATLRSEDPAPLSIEFGQDAYLTDAYLQETPGCQCGKPAFATGGTDVRGPLPDGSWFRLVALESRGGDVHTVILQRGWEGQDPELEITLDTVEGIVRLEDRGRERAWGIKHPRADWMRAIGARAMALECATTVD